MTLPKASSSFTIPSLYDDLELDCRIYYSRWSEKNIPFFGRSFAILGHPYAPLGGCYDDPVVSLVGAALLKQGFTVGTFNFRGAQGSSGRTSWSGKPELADYVSFYGLMLALIDAMGKHRTRTKTSGAEAHEQPLLVLSGYSYGSLIASHLPPSQLVANIMSNAKAGSAEFEIQSRAQQLARDLAAYFETKTESSISRGRSDLRPNDTPTSPARSIVMGGYESESASRRISRESSRKSLDADRVRQSIDRARQKFKSRSSSDREVNMGTMAPEHDQLSVEMPNIAYLLISPLLPPVAGFATMFSSLTFERKAGYVDNKLLRSENDELATHPTCVIYGDKDVFTSYKKLRKWTEALRAKPGSQITPYEVDGASHFWNETGASTKLQHAIEGWLQILNNPELP